MKRTGFSGKSFIAARIHLAIGIISLFFALAGCENLLDPATSAQGAGTAGKTSSTLSGTEGLCAETFCPPPRSIESYPPGNARGQYQCEYNEAWIIAISGMGRLNFSMEGGQKYSVTGSIIKENINGTDVENGNAFFTTPGGSIIATTEWKDFSFYWTEGDCTYECNSGTGTGTRIINLSFKRYTQPQGYIQYLYKSNQAWQGGTANFCAGQTVAFVTDISQWTPIGNLPFKGWDVKPVTQGATSQYYFTGTSGTRINFTAVNGTIKATATY